MLRKWNCLELWDQHGFWQVWEQRGSWPSRWSSRCECRCRADLYGRTRRRLRRCRWGFPSPCWSTVLHCPPSMLQTNKLTLMNFETIFTHNQLHHRDHQRTFDFQRSCWPSSGSCTTFDTRCCPTPAHLLFARRPASRRPWSSHPSSPSRSLFPFPAVQRCRWTSRAAERSGRTWLDSIIAKALEKPKLFKEESSEGRS